MNKAELARRSGLSKATLTKIEQGKNQMSKPDTRAALAAALDVPPMQFNGYLEGSLDLPDVAPPARGPIDVAIEYHGADKWPPSVIDAARKLPLRGLSPAEWAAQLDMMKAAQMAAPDVWQRLSRYERLMKDDSGLELVESEPKPRGKK